MYCGNKLTRFHDWYKQVHGYASLLVCMFGSVANVLNIAVLTRPEMSSPTNKILTGLAVADLIVMLVYIPFVCHMYLLKRETQEMFTYGWAVFVDMYTTLSQVCHTVSIWLTVTLAVWRCVAVAYPQRNRTWCSPRRTLLAVLAGYIVCPLICFPLYLNHTIVSTPYTDNVTGNHTIYLVRLSEIGQANSDLVFIVYSVVIKLIPCALLSLLSARLIYALVETKRRRRALSAGSNPSKKSTRNADKERQTDRTTRMLLAVLVLFLLTELPQGTLGLLSVLFGQQFFEECYAKLGDLMDQLALVNSAINFMIYCGMSRQFRHTFAKLFRPRWLPVAQTENGVNNHNMTTTVVTQV